MQQFPWNYLVLHMKQSSKLPSHACHTHCRAGRCVRASSLPFSMKGAMRSAFCMSGHCLLCHCVHSLPHRLAAGIGTRVPHKLGHAALSIHFHMKKWSHLKPERTFSGFSSLTAFQKSYCLPLFLKCTLYKNHSLGQEISRFNYFSGNLEKNKLASQAGCLETYADYCWKQQGFKHSEYKSFRILSITVKSP